MIHLNVNILWGLFTDIINRYLKSWAFWHSHTLPFFPISAALLLSYSFSYARLWFLYCFSCIYFFSFENYYLTYFFYFPYSTTSFSFFSPFFHFLTPFIMLVWNNLIPQVDGGKFQRTPKNISPPTSTN